jgi:predicted house-cleaning noncanonical NTP pyrophosphatase (MazG superfamily)
VLEELADVYEVLVTIGRLEGRSESMIVAAAHDKRMQRGGFGEGLVWIKP